VRVGSPAFTLTVNGSNFMSSSVVRWNGANRPTTFVSRYQLRAVLTAGDVDVAGTARVTVATSGGTSNGATFTITTGTATTMIIDNAPVGVEDTLGDQRTFTGRWCRSADTEAYGSDSLQSCGTGLDTYRWTPNIPATRVYDVYVWYTTQAGRSANVPYTVAHAGGSTTKTFSQLTGGGRWVFHGRYTFNLGRSGYVQVSDANGSAGADAVRLVPAL
jgi:hypothetical protein